MPFKTILGLTVLVLLTLSTPLIAQGETGTVQGTAVVDGQPLAGAQAVLSCTARSDFEAKTTTDEAGTFEFLDIPVGDFAVQVYNGDDELVAEGQGTVNVAGDTVVVEMTPVS